MHKVSWGRERADLRALKQKIGASLGGAIFNENNIGFKIIS